MTFTAMSCLICHCGMGSGSGAWGVCGKATWSRVGISDHHVKRQPLKMSMLHDSLYSYPVEVRVDGSV